MSKPIKKVPKPVQHKRCKSKDHWKDIIVWGRCQKCQRVLA